MVPIVLRPRILARPDPWVFGAGRADLVMAMCKGAVAMGADALLIEVHPNPAEAWSDGAQQLSLELFAKLMQELKPFITAAGRE